MMAFFCLYGHMLECHFPYRCREAGCSHLNRYDFEPEQVEELENTARAAIAAGKRSPYMLDEHGNAVVKQEDE
jgi:hypothetical protein